MTLSFCGRQPRRKAERMTDSELLFAGYEAIHEAHTVAGAAVREIHDHQELGHAVKGNEHVAQFRAVRERAELAASAFRELEQRAMGMNHQDTKKGKVNCFWKKDEQSGAWDTGCGEAHWFTDAGPTENLHKFCPYCGRELVVEIGQK